MILTLIGALICLLLVACNTSLKIYLYDLPEFRRLHNEIVAPDPRHAGGDVRSVAWSSHSLMICS